MNHYRPKVYINKITLFIVAATFVTLILIGRLFNLQILKHSYFQEVAARSQYGFTELLPQRGEIILQDHHSGEEFLVATNTTLNLVYADPTLVKDPVFVADKLTPLIFDVEDARAADNERINDAAKKLPADISEEEKNEILKPLNDTELEEQFRADIITKISEKKRSQILLYSDIEAEKLAKLPNLPGIEVIENNVYAYPPQISDPAFVAENIADILEIPASHLETVLEGKNRYVILKRKLEPEISREIEKLSKEYEEEFSGISMREEYFRYYPEDSLAANIIGYVNHNGIGQYGIESSFNKNLAGVAGKFQTKKDSIGRQITVGESVLEAAVDGDDIVLTIDRSIQMKVEEELKKAVEDYRADSGQIIVMNPQTGEILAMAHYPTFDPNNYGDAFKKIEIELKPEEIAELYPTNDEGIYYFYRNAITLDRYLIFEEKDDNGNSHYYRYENFVGPEVYHNKIVSWPYEPGSVFKTIAMASAIDDGDVTPNTTFNDSGPIEVDYNVYTGKYDFSIKNATGYYGLVNMTTVLAKSLNTGMTFVAKKMGPALFYSYLEKFGFMDRTDIEFDNETTGQIEYFEGWSESELATHAFGQGITATMIQVLNAYGAIVNGGILMKPYIVKEIRHDDGSITVSEPQEIRRVISEETASKMVTMLTYSAENGEAKRGQVPGHYVGGKTGTSQTYKHGIALSGPGTTIGTFAGFGPVNDPQFVILIKLDYPRASEWGSATAGPTFSKIATYLFDYYNIPPDK